MVPSFAIDWDLSAVHVAPETHLPAGRLHENPLAQSASPAQVLLQDVAPQA